MQSKCIPKKKISLSISTHRWTILKYYILPFPQGNCSEVQTLSSRPLSFPRYKCLFCYSFTALTRKEAEYLHTFLPCRCSCLCFNWLFTVGRFSFRQHSTAWQTTNSCYSCGKHDQRAAAHSPANAGFWNESTSAFFFFFLQLRARNAAAATGPYVTFMKRLASNGLEKQT